MTQESRESRASKWVIPILVAFIGSGFGGAWLSSVYSDRIASREITAELLKILSSNILQSSALPTNLADASNEQLSALLTQKEQAFLIRKMTSFLETNYGGIDFKEILPALNSIQTRYSYARIYEAAGMVEIVCENLSFADPNWNKLSLSSANGKCDKETVKSLEGVVLERKDFDWENQNFRIDISNDYGNLLCHQRTHKDSNCNFSVDLTDRLENLPYEHMIITEYMGYLDPPTNSQSVVNFSIVKKKSKEDQDRSYWDYKLNVSRDQDIENSCPDFFDDDERTLAAPSPPELDNFDRMVLRACGPIRGTVTRKEFKQLISDFFDLLLRKLEPVPNEWSGLLKVQIINEIHRIWTIYGGFTHVFCGDWDRGSIGGFHNFGRYLQLQMEGSACYVESSLEDVAENHVYTIGARSSDGRNVHPIKGYSLNRSALDLFTLATQVFYIHLNTKEGWEKKHYDLWEKNIFVKVKEGEREVTYRVLAQATDPNNKRTFGIKTIYPDLTPNDGFTVINFQQ